MKHNSTPWKKLAKWSARCEVLVGVAQTGVGVFVTIVIFSLGDTSIFFKCSSEE